MKVVTFNLRVDVEVDNFARFRNRKGLILEKIDTEKPDIIGFQEMRPFMRDFLIKHLGDYQIAGRSRSQDYTGEHADIAVRRDKYEIIGLDYFWLSETPYVPGSRYAQQSDCPRITTAAVLHELDTNRLFRFINTHLDHIGEQARVLGINQIIQYIAQQNDKEPMPFFLTGDFNATPDSQTLAACYNSNEPKIVDLTAEMGGTFHDYGRREPAVKIDYILCDAETAKKPYKTTLWNDCSFGLYLSDHYPVCCEIDF